MIVMRLRNSATQAIAALGLIGLMSAAPVQAVQLDPMLQTSAPAPLADVAEVVADLVDPVATSLPAPVRETYRHIGQGEASYYGHELAGNRTASGERFNPRAMTAAHRTLPMGTRLRVTNRANGRSVIVRINDRGPFVGRRIIDVSLGAAEQIRMVRSGKAMVTLERLI